MVTAHQVAPHCAHTITINESDPYCYYNVFADVQTYSVHVYQRNKRRGRRNANILFKVKNAIPTISPRFCCIKIREKWDLRDPLKQTEINEQKPAADAGSLYLRLKFHSSATNRRKARLQHQLQSTSGDEKNKANICIKYRSISDCSNNNGDVKESQLPRRSSAIERAISVCLQCDHKSSQTSTHASENAATSNDAPILPQASHTPWRHAYRRVRRRSACRSEVLIVSSDNKSLGNHSLNECGDLQITDDKPSACKWPICSHEMAVLTDMWIINGLTFWCMVVTHSTVNKTEQIHLSLKVTFRWPWLVTWNRTLIEECLGKVERQSDAAFQEDDRDPRLTLKPHDTDLGLTPHQPCTSV